MPKQQFLAFDLGAESGRAMLGRLDSGRLELAERHRFANPMGKMRGHLHWNLLAQWEELKKGLRNAAADGKIDGIGVDTWGVDFGLLDMAGELLANPVMYRDARTDGVLDQTFAIVPREKIFQTTGLQFMQLNTLYQLMALRLEKSPLLEAAHSMLLMPDLFHYLFSGVSNCEQSIASTTQMYDPVQQTWAQDMIEQLGLPAKLLQPIVPAGTVLGPLLADVAKECGVGQIPVITPGSHDTASAVAAVPAEGKDGWCYISSGTWSLMGLELDEPVITDKSLAYNYTNEIGVSGKVRFLKNIMGMWLVQECRRQWQTQGHDHTYAELTAMAARSAGLEVLIDPEYPPFLAPGDMVGKIERFCHETKQKPPMNRGDFVRACLDSLALTYRRMRNGLQDVTGKKINVIHIVGGGCQNELLNQMTADACGCVVLAGPIEATAAGNILTQAMAVGTLKSLDDIRAVVRNSFDVKRFEPRETRKWDAAYEQYQAILAKRS